MWLKYHAQMTDEDSINRVTGRENESYERKAYTCATMFTTNYTRTTLGLNTGLHHEKLAIAGLS
jgi:hypothetical protein